MKTLEHLKELPTKKARIEWLKEMISSEDRWAVRALMAIYAKQTESEKASHCTKEANNVGFSGRDAEFLTSLAEQHKTRGTLTARQMNCLKRSIKKYAGQLYREYVDKRLSA